MIFGIGTTDPVRQEQLRGAYGEWATPPDPDVGFFTGALSSPFKGVSHAVSIGASVAAETAVPILETVTPDSIDVWLRDKRRSAYEWMSNSRADPKTMGMLAQAGHAVGTVGTLGVAGGLMGGLPGAAGMVAAGTGYDKFREVLDQTGDVAVSAKVAGTTALVMGAGVMLPPYMGATIAKQIASGVAVNVGLGVTERGVSGAFLEDKYPEVAQHYKAFDAASMLIDGVLGAAIPVGARLMKLDGAPTIADTDTAMTGRAGIAEQTRDPVVQTTLDGIDRQRAAANEITRQIIEEGRSPADIEVPAGIMDDVVENPEFKQTVTRTVKAVNDFFSEEGYRPLKKVDTEIENLAKAFREGADEVMSPVKFNEAEARDFLQKKMQELTPEQQSIIEEYANDLKGLTPAMFNDPAKVEALRKSVTVADFDFVVYRGDAPGRLTARYDEHLVPTSLSRKWAETMAGAIWSEPTINKIIVRKGTPFIPIGKGDLNELEVILPTKKDLVKLKSQRFEEGQYREANGVVDQLYAWEREVFETKPEPDTTARTTEEPDPDQFTQVPAKNIADNRPDMQVEDADGNVTTAKDLLAKADDEFKKSQQESQLYKVAVACAIGVGE